MSRDVEWTSEERQRASTLMDADARAFGRDTSQASVAPGECREWRARLAREPTTPSRIEADYSRGTVENHARGDCGHDPQVVGLPVVFRGGEWTRARVISTGTDPSNLRVYHTTVCGDFPESVEPLPDGVLRQKWRECRTCSGGVPEAKGVPEARDS